MRKITVTLVFLIIVSVFACSVPANAYTLPAGTNIEAASVILYNVNSDTTVYEYNISERREPASLTKLMTALIVAESDSDPASTVITADAESILEISGTGASNAGLKAGEEMSSLNLLYCLLVSSGCDVANVLATHYAGSIGAFVEKMNARAAELGMNDTHFVNAHGLSADGQYTTAHDLFLLAKEVTKHDNLTEICSKVRYTVPATNKASERILSTTNLMMDPSTDAFYRYTTGLKTGYTDNAGRCLISTAEKDGQKYLCVMLGCPVYGSNGSFVRREFTFSKSLYEWAFNSLTLSRVCDTETPRAEVKIKYSSKDHVLVTAAEEVYTVIPKESESTLVVEPHLEKSELEAPVSAGTVVGSASVYCAGDLIATVDLVITESCERSTLSFIFGMVTSVITSKLFIVIAVLLVLAAAAFITVNIIYNRRRRRRLKYSIRPRRKP